MDFGIEGKKALVLASSRGLGLGIAKALALEGADVLLSGRNEQRLNENAEAINSLGKGRAHFLVADLFDANFVQTMRDHVEKLFGGVDIIINNSGGPQPGLAGDITAPTLETYFNAMVLRPITLTNQLLPGMKARGWGRIVTIASGGVIEPIANLALSNTLRPALAGWSKTLAREIAPFGITANLLLPGSIWTDRIEELNQSRAEQAGASVEDVRAQAEAKIPMGRYGRIEEFAAVAAFLCSQQASYVTGSMIRCDGGAISSV